MTFVDFSAQQALSFEADTEKNERKKLGQFMTPVSIARFMASKLCEGFQQDTIRILDPAAGTGMLGAAVIENLLSKSKPPKSVHICFYEIDETLIPILQELVERIQVEAFKKEIIFSYEIIAQDFLLSESALSQQSSANLIISNPPYFKINKNDSRASSHAYAVHGQPNIYGLFMAATCRLLSADGRWCFITPRSWMGGAYFKYVRRHIIENINFDRLHTFASRKDHFDGEILQEASIAWGTRKLKPKSDYPIIISSSHSASDLNNIQQEAFDFESIISNDEHLTIAIPECLETAELFSNWENNLATFGFKVSTGPVVPFRCKEWVKESPDAQTVPLLWMQHITRSGIQWPIQKKREHIASSTTSERILLDNLNYVILRRFSPKEDLRRLTSCAYLGQFQYEKLGIENHLNYIHKPGGELESEEAIGLSAFLNCEYVDKYFRSVSGHTQINATDLKKLPLPPLEAIKKIGSLLTERSTLEDIDNAVKQIIGPL